ncbi:MAG: chloride channel protein [Muricomes sp.]
MVDVIVSVLLLLLYQGRYAGLGTNPIDAAFHGDKIFSCYWILKALITILSLAAGFQGGEVTPLFSTGASLGVVLGGIFHLPVELVAALGHASVFGSATNTFLAPVIIRAEVFVFAYLPHFILVCAFAYIFNLNKSIYSEQKLIDRHDRIPKTRK